MNSLAYADLITADISSANSIMCTLQQIAQSFGVAMSALLMRFFSIFFAEQIVLTPRVFDDTFLIMGVLTLCSVLIYLPLERDDGRQMLVKPT